MRYFAIIATLLSTTAQAETLTLNSYDVCRGTISMLFDQPVENVFHVKREGQNDYVAFAISNEVREFKCFVDYDAKRVYWGYATGTFSSEVITVNAYSGDHMMVIGTAYKSKKWPWVRD